MTYVLSCLENLRVNNLSTLLNSLDNNYTIYVIKLEYNLIRDMYICISMFTSIIVVFFFV